jgi:plasmid stabilization system protein ParE
MRTDLADGAVRFWPVFSYLVVYRSDTNPIQIVRVLHGKRDVRRLLEE